MIGLGSDKNALHCLVTDKLSVPESVRKALLLLCSLLAIVVIYQAVVRSLSRLFVWFDPELDLAMSSQSVAPAGESS